MTAPHHLSSWTRRAVVLGVIGAGVSGLLYAQAQGGEWTTSAGDAQRTGWIRADARLTRQAVDEGEFAFLWKMKFDNQPRQLHALTEPTLQDRLIGYRGFKALAFVGGSDDRLFAVDSDLARPYWTTHLTYAVATGGQPPSTWECPGGLVATPSRRTALVPSAFGSSGGGGGSRARSAVGEPGKGAAVLKERAIAAAASSTPKPVPARDVVPRDVPPPAPVNPALAPVPFGGVDPIYAMGSDGLLRVLRVSDGAPIAPMVPFLPPGARPSALTFIRGVIYTTTSHGCGAAPNGVWALDLTKDNAVTTWPSGAASVAGDAGPTFGADGTLYVATTNAPASADRRYANSVVALDRATLAPRDWLTTGDADFNATLVVFKYKERQLLAASGNNGRLYLLDTASLGGADHRSPLYVTPKYSAGGTGGGLATWEDESGTRWVVASVHGGPTTGVTFAANGLAPAGSVVAFKLLDAGGQLTLAPVWRSPNLVSPLPPLVVNGMVIAAGSGEYRAGSPTLSAPQRRRRSLPARLYVLDAVTGRPLWNSGTTIASAARARMAAGSGQVYLVTGDNHLYAFGIPMEH